MQRAADLPLPPHPEQVCDEQLLQTPETQLLEKENSGCEALLRDNKVRRVQRPSRRGMQVAAACVPPDAVAVSDAVAPARFAGRPTTHTQHATPSAAHRRSPPRAQRLPR